MEQEIRFLRRPDGVQLAYAVVGDGPPLVQLFPWGNIEGEWALPWMRRGIDELAEGRTVIRLDRHGTGLSDRDRDDYSLEADLRDVEALADHLALDRFAIAAVFFQCPTAIAYAVRHPGRVEAIVLRSAFALGARIAPPEVQKVIIDTVRTHWGLGSRQIAVMQGPDLGVDATREVARFNRDSVTAEVAAGMIAAAYAADVRDLAPEVRCPTLIVQMRDGDMVPKAATQEVASLIPGSRYVVVEDDDERRRVTLEFLGVKQTGDRMPITVLFTDRTSSTELGQRLGDAAGHVLQRRHDEVTRRALSTHGGTEVKHTGDGIMATFRSPSSAIGCAIDIQRALATDDDLQVRVGLACGEVVHEGDDVFGSTVQLAARVCDRARPGQVLVPEAVRQLAGSRGFTFGAPRSVTLKGFAERLRLYEVRWDD
jgi:class 3 adenylate cyclase